jgi:hypothetical protein
MKIWADHKLTSGDKVTCPLCRSEFPLDFLRDLKQQAAGVKKQKAAFSGHTDSQCSLCRAAPIVGERYHCVVCQMLDFCGKCYRLGSHQHHPFIVRKKPHEAWQAAEPIDPVFNARLTRELAPAVYEPHRPLDTTQTLHEFLASVLPTTDQGSCVFCSLEQPALIRRKLKCGHCCHEVSAMQTCLTEALRANCNGCPVEGMQILPGLDSRKR